ncbi:hypothetical protein DPMN_145109 [Dreissena polymorpha]|uniref:Uncharacterized protein n=1 Tax=Dreissena polymorpha TaxID=45954 RepID=A0A9D4F7Q7_DREPO|nr:hypothetical protein DPMN_145109 [Dreissena polymorpha]
MFKQNFGWAWSMWAGRPRIYRIVIRDFQYHFEVNRCRNEEVNVKNGGRGRRVFPSRMFDPGGAPGVVIGLFIVEIDCIVIRDVRYQLEVNRCKSEEVNFQGYSGQDGQTDGGRR